MSDAPPNGGSGSGPAPPRGSRRGGDPFWAQRKGASASRRAPESDPEPAREYEPVSLEEGDSPDPATDHQKVAQMAQFQSELDASALGGMLALRLDYCDSGVSRVHLPAGKLAAESGPVEGAVVGALCLAAGHFAAASVAPHVGIRIVEDKVNLLGVVQGNLLAIGEVVRKGRTLIVCRVEVVEDNDRVVAVALTTHLQQSP